MHRIVFTSEAQHQINAIYDYVAQAASHNIARRFTDAILSHIDGLADYPSIGTPRNDVRPGLRTLVHRRRVTIAFMVEDQAVVVIGFYYGGQDFATLLRDEGL
ncbi:type II toxin-antitoxin system RelE/ParE family toxin [Sphingobium sp. HWE2-09]|uniref:type II toxin-antitoxin system RelE/ParE family toxin n=1 Tax=Sphingobium sp. HWE2-09 TaxID=3108390 RepID=UPI002DD06C34|nr:type II toxin-antitoxin system RelE/ParE family toxin [Sphingobium sp. HWE2-09]